MKKLILISLVIVLLSSCMHVHGEPVVEKVERAYGCTHKYIITTDCGSFASNKEYKIGDVLTKCN